jgi:hypothetical protein
MYLVCYRCKIIDCVLLELYTNSFGGTELKTNYIWGYANKKGSIPPVCITRYFFSWDNMHLENGSYLNLKLDVTERNKMYVIRNMS